jgi:hypothetical protein
MKTTTKLGTILCMAGMLVYGETWHGKLIDASCFEQFSTAATSGKKTLDLDKLDKDCAPTAATSRFAVLDGDKIYKLDAPGNSKVLAVIYGGAVKADHDKDVNVTVSGKLNDGTIAVESVKGK